LRRYFYQKLQRDAAAHGGAAGEFVGGGSGGSAVPAESVVAVRCPRGPSYPMMKKGSYFEDLREQSILRCSRTRLWCGMSVR